ncbi:4-hydroxy-tetrahydrodipicolinate synthase [bacterium]|nr:MAG: 4-hydroxy-tetrahydrodipicolinate synthase [bacterium]
MGAFQGPREWGRLLTAMLTPFDSDGNVDYAETERLAAYLVDEQRNEGLVINGTTGESPTLTHSEKEEILKVVLRTVGDRASVVFGAGTYSTAESIELARMGEKAGAHGIMFVNPYYNRPGQAGLYAHFSTASRETGLPVMLYNIIPRSAINMETSTLLRLIEDVPNIVAVKEASGSMAQIQEVCAAAPEGFRVYSGDDALTLPVMSVGGYGLVSVSAHVVGAKLREVIETYPTDPARAREVYLGLLPVFKALFSAPSPVPVKYATSLAGFRCASVRLPLVPLSEAEKDVVLQALAQAGIETARVVSTVGSA